MIVKPPGRAGEATDASSPLHWILGFALQLNFTMFFVGTEVFLQISTSPATFVCLPSLYRSCGVNDKISISKFTSACTIDRLLYGVLCDFYYKEIVCQTICLRVKCY